jgi:hypothetical protein
MLSKENDKPDPPKATTFPSVSIEPCPKALLLTVEKCTCAEGLNPDGS